MAQVQCPNCGGYRVNWRGTYHEDSKGGYHGLAWSPTEKGWALFLILFTLGLGFILQAIVKGIIIARWKPKGANRWDWTCELCGYEWIVRKGQPAATIRVRPDLIAKGEERLRRHEEERKLMPPPPE